MDNSFTISAILTFIILAYLIISYLTPEPEDKIIEGYQSKPEGVGIGSTISLDNIKKFVQQKKDLLLVPKYYKNYEQIILQMDEFINLQMLEMTVNIADENSQSVFNKVYYLNALKQAKDALADVMKYNDEASKA
jgi:hypothetical protein